MIRLPRSPAILTAMLLTLCVRSFADDCNHNGVEDSDEVAAGTSRDCNLDSIPDECQAAPLEFGLRDEAIQTNRFPRAITCVDVNGDGFLDVVTANASGDTTSTLTVLLNDGDGRFEPRTHDNGVRTSSIAAADLDADGAVDLVTANFFTVDVLWNDGTGAFESSTSLEVDRATRFATLGDLDGDSLPDLISTNTSTDEATVLRNNGDRTFEAPVRHPTGEYPTDAVVIDTNGDGAADIVTLNRDTSDVTVLVNDGAGGMTRGGDFPIGTQRPFSLITADFDLDGQADLAVAARDAVSVLSGDSNGSFAVSYQVETSPTRLTAADLDGDGDTDIAFGASFESAVLTLVNTSEGFFVGPTPFGVEFVPDLMSSGDLDGDGDVDLVAAVIREARVGILWNGDAASLSFRSVLVNMSPAPHAAVIGDLDGDGFADYATGDGLGSTISIFRNDGAGNLRPQRAIAAGRYLNSVDGGDFDGDGDLDLVTAAIRDNRMQVFLNGGPAAFGARREYPTGVRPFHVHVGELTGDGQPEIISSNENSATITVYRNAGDGSGMFRSRQDYRVGSQPVSSATGDFNRDGHEDIVVAARGTRRFVVLLNEGDGTFGDPSSFSVDGAPWYVATGDFNGDRLVDVATALLSNRRVGIFFGRGDGTFEDGMNFNAGAPPYSLIVQDMNRDGSPDIVTANQDTDNLSILLNRGDGTFSPGLTNDAGDAPRFVSAADLENDGDVDLVAANHDGRDLTVYYNQAPVASTETHLEEICTELEFHMLSTASSRGRDLKFVIPVDPDDPSLLPPQYQNGRLFDLHQDFLAAVYPDRFPALGPQEYNRLVGRRETRDYYIGSITRLAAASGVIYGFSVFVDVSESASELLTLEEVRSIYETFQGSFQLETLAYLPDSVPARERAAAWEDPGFPIVLDSSIPGAGYIPYTEAVGYGTVKILDRDAFEEAADSGTLSSGDIIVISFAPRDIEGVVSGVITAQEQGPLSHVFVRTARRGTPNAYLEGAMSAFAPFEGELVRLEVKRREFTVEPASLADAEAFWQTNRPQLETQPRLDAEFAALTSLADMNLDSPPGDLESRFGGKATNFARLQAILTGEFAPYGEVGFAIPMHHYVEFMTSNRTLSMFEPLSVVTYQEFLEEILASEEFRTDSRFRFTALERLRDTMVTGGIVDPELVTAIAAKVGEVFGATDAKVRLRSSSNVEDALEFNGAGLYNSYSACAADDLDDDDDGPSRCDDSQSNERGIDRGIKRVWASLWNFRAFEERSFYGIPQEIAAMGILVSRTFENERSNGVVFTGSPTNPLDTRYLITSQVGENSVVSPEPGQAVEVDLALVDDGEVLELVRASASSLVAEGEQVLDDDQLHELSRVLWHIDQGFPVETGSHDRREIVLDLEFKFESDGALAIKQIRPFLRNATLPPTPAFQLRVEPATALCVGLGLSSIGRDPRLVHELKSTVRLRAGEHTLETDALVAPFELFDQVRFGPDAELLSPASPGLIRSTRIGDSQKLTRHPFLFEQTFVIDEDWRLSLSMRLDDAFTARGETPVRSSLDVDEELIESGLAVFGRIFSVSDPDGLLFVDYTSCHFESLDLWETRAELTGGARISILERYRPPAPTDTFGPVRMREAVLEIAGQRRRVTSYWDLVYAASRHNTFVQHWIVLDPPLDVPDLPRPIAVVELVSEQLGVDGAVLQESGATYLDTDLVEIASPAVRSLVLEPYVPPESVPFQRGDVDGDGRLVLTDAVSLLNFLFAQGVTPPCEKAADADDDGELTLSDGVVVLGHLFQGQPPPEPPFDGCGEDPTADALTCEAFGPCRANNE